MTSKKEGLSMMSQKCASCHIFQELHTRDVIYMMWQGLQGHRDIITSWTQSRSSCKDKFYHDYNCQRNFIALSALWLSNLVKIGKTTRVHVRDVIFVKLFYDYVFSTSLTFAVALSLKVFFSLIMLSVEVDCPGGEADSF